MNDLDRILSAGGDIVPSSGFTASVMDAVRREASEPPPISFPWMRALPLGIAWLVAVVLFVAAAKQATSVSATSRALAGVTHVIRSAYHAIAPYGGGWMILALVLTAACVFASLRWVRAKI